MGESSGLTIINDEQLQNLAQKVVNSKGAEKEAACDAFASHLASAEVYTEGGWQDAWPTGFGGNKAVPRYKWDHLGLTAEALAKKIAAGKIDSNDLAVETIVVDMQSKTVSETAEFIVDSKESGIGKKPACRSNKFFANVIIGAYPENEVKQNVAITDLIPDYSVECDPICVFFPYSTSLRRLPRISTGTAKKESTGSRRCKKGLPNGKPFLLIP